MLQVDSVSIAYGHIQAVRNASLNVARGEIVALLGPNGAGKSSLMRTIAGLQAPFGGSIAWDGARLDGRGAPAVARAGVSLAPEGRQLQTTLSVHDNLLLGGYLHHARRWRDLLGPVGWLSRRADVRARMARVFALFPRLEERQGQTAGSLSGGEQQMLVVGRAMMAEPQLLLLDEPSLGLAPNLVREILATLTELNAQGVTILLVEQDAHAALRIAQRAYIMETGRIVAEGTPRELLASPQMRNAYLGAI
jgi:branched-chain amino acid transport system ATP-binding protein